MTGYPALPRIFDPIAQGRQRVLLLTADDPLPQAGDVWVLYEWDPARPEAETFVARCRHRQRTRPDAADSLDSLADDFLHWHRLCRTGRACRVRILHVLADPDGAWLQPRVVAASIAVEATWTEPPAHPGPDVPPPMPR